MLSDNRLTPEANLLVVRPGGPPSQLRQRVTERFFGEVVSALPESAGGRRIYVCGDLAGLALPSGVRVITDLSEGHGPLPEGVVPIHSGQVPLSVHGLGVLFEVFFGEQDLYSALCTEHVFQALTESTKPSHALRTGIYLSDVRREDDGLHFNLLRCSSNLSGPTDNFRATDRRILAALRDAAGSLFARDTGLNHVLAQIYRNERVSPDKERKAKISAHSDKTKDMAADGAMAFCSFYEPAALARLEPTPKAPRDRGHRGQSGLMRLHFRRKSDDPTLVESFTVPLYPNAVFFMPLSTNRLYTHALRSSILDTERAATRMGYVVRSSAQEAVFADGRTHLVQDGRLVPLAPMDIEGAATLRDDYLRENRTDEAIDYGAVEFSMNAGDYLQPLE